MVQKEYIQPTPNAIKAARKKAGLSYKQAADLAGLSSSVTWEKMESGSAVMPEPTWNKFNSRVASGYSKDIKGKITTATKYEINDLVKKSKAWFDSESKSLAASTQVKLKGTTVGQPVPGEMYMFYYDAKHKDTLPFWDKFPLVFPFRIVPDGFYGINLHYLHYKERVLLLDALEVIASSPRKETSKKLQISYSILQQVAKNKKFEKCIHRYLFDHLRTPLKKIHSDKWIVASLLPNEMFVGATNKQIWSM
jgi:transcriptional regulator with XRE-family HTH domain